MNNNNKKSSPWILSWLSQLTSKSSTAAAAATTTTTTTTAGATAATTATTDKWSSTHHNKPIIIADEPILLTNKKIQFEPRPSITISLSSERRNSQQTMSSSFTSDDQYAASYYQRRDSSERSILSDLWLKTKRKNLNKLHKQDCYHRQMDHFKRYSISSSSPSVSRPNSILISQPNSPHLYLNNYILPDDEIDTYWLDDDNTINNQLLNKDNRWLIKHELIKLAVDGLFAFDELMTTLSSTIEKYVLQIGCGDGLWGIDIAIQNPKWMVLGIDNMDTINKQVPMTRTIPRNFKFVKCQSLIQALSSFSDASFDFITSRFLMLDHTSQQYQDVLTEALRLCKPNGYIEVMELDMRIYHQKVISVTTTHLLNNEVILALENKSLDPRLARRLNDLIEKESKSKYISLPLGAWGGRLGVMFREDIHQLFEKLIVQRTEDAFEYKLDLMDNELEANRAFMNLHVMLIHK